MKKVIVASNNLAQMTREPTTATMTSDVRRHLLSNFQGFIKPLGFYRRKVITSQDDHLAIFRAALGKSDEDFLSSDRGSQNHPEDTSRTAGDGQNAHLVTKIKKNCVI